MPRPLLLETCSVALLAAMAVSLGAQELPSETDGSVKQTEEITAVESGPSDDAQGLPADPSQAGRPSLDYVPSESISEDRSVSFPVDI